MIGHNNYIIVLKGQIKSLISIALRSRRQTRGCGGLDEETQEQKPRKARELSRSFRPFVIARIMMVPTIVSNNSNE